MVLQLQSYGCRKEGRAVFVHNSLRLKDLLFSSVRITGYPLEIARRRIAKERDLSGRLDRAGQDSFPTFKFKIQIEKVGSSHDS